MGNKPLTEEQTVIDADFDDDEIFLAEIKNNCLQGQNIAI